MPWLITVGWLCGGHRERMCEALGLPELATGEAARRRYSVQSDTRAQLIAEVTDAFKTKPRDEWVDILVAADVPCAPCNTYDEIADPTTEVGRHFAENEYIVEFEHPMLHTTHKAVGVPTDFSVTPAGIAGVAPTLGQHTDSVLGDIGFR